MNKTVISFDFGGTVAIWDEKNNSLKANKEIVSLIEEYNGLGCETIIISSCEKKEIKDLWDFVNVNNIPISNVFCTEGNPKVDFVNNICSAIHYDDDSYEIFLINKLKNTRWILVNGN